MVDLLGQYGSEGGSSLSGMPPQWQPAQEGGFIVRLLEKLSGGRIRDARQANYVLVGIAVAVFLISAWAFYRQAVPSVSTKEVIQDTPVRGIRGNAQ